MFTKLVNASKALSVATEQNVAVTFDARTQTTRIYINGDKVAEGTAVTNEPYELSALKADTRNYIGRTQWWDSNVKTDNLDYCGTMDNFRLYGIVLTEKELMDVYEDDATSLSQVQFSSDIRLSANVVAVGEDITFEGAMSFDETGTVELFDARGRRVYVASVVSLPHSVRVNVPAGMYFVRVMKGTEQVFTSKLLVR
ncbi:MAG: T9SS type A sorting domain-containing protein [Paraprevotella sp.]|nr:T9SS type A sorting domain-containing protein [Paraprevotella sp.]